MSMVNIIADLCAEMKANGVDAAMRRALAEYGIKDGPGRESLRDVLLRCSDYQHPMDAEERASVHERA